MNMKKDFNKKSAKEFLAERAKYDQKERMYVKLIDEKTPTHTILKGLSQVLSQSYHEDEKLAAIELHKDKIKDTIEAEKEYSLPTDIWNTKENNIDNEIFPHNKLNKFHRNIGNLALKLDSHSANGDKTDVDKNAFIERTKKVAQATVSSALKNNQSISGESYAQKVLERGIYIELIKEFENDAKACYKHGLDLSTEKQKPSFYYTLANDVMFADIDAKEEKDFNWIKQRNTVFGDVANTKFFEKKVKENTNEEELLTLEKIASKRVRFSIHSIKNRPLVNGASNFHRKLREDVRNVQSIYFNNEIQDKAKYHFTDSLPYSKRDTVRGMLEWKPAYASALAYMGAAIELEKQKNNTKAYESLKQELNWN